MSTNEPVSDKRTDSIDHTNPDTLRRLYCGEMLSINEIADRAGVDYQTVWYHLDKNGIERRDKVSELKRRNRVEVAKYYTTKEGRTYWRSWNHGGDTDYVLVYRLLAVAEYGFDAVCGMHVHHLNEIPWDNRPDNIELMTPEEHGRHHWPGNTD